VSSWLAVLRKELAGYLIQPLGWVVLTLFLLVQGYAFYLFLAVPQAARATSAMQLFFGGTFFHWLFVIVVVATITMRSLAEERRSGTLETLMTAPVTELQVVLGKYVAAVAFYACLWLPTATYVLLVWLFAPPGALDLGPILSAYLGCLVIGAACISVGVLASALVRSQLVAALLCCVALASLLLAGLLEATITTSTARRVIHQLNLFAHMDDFARGVVDTRHLVLHGSLVVFCLTAAVLALGRRKWR